MKLSHIDKLLNQAESLLWEEIERKVITILKSENNAAYTFLCAMGGYCFYDREGEPIPDRQWMKTLDLIFEKYDDAFKLTGAGVRWDLDPVTREVRKLNDW